MSDHTSAGIFGDIMDALAARLKKTRNGSARKAIKGIGAEVFDAFSNADFCPEDAAPDALVDLNLAERCDACECVFIDLRDHECEEDDDAR